MHEVFNLLHVVVIILRDMNRMKWAILKYLYLPKKMKFKNSTNAERFWNEELDKWQVL